LRLGIRHFLSDGRPEEPGFLIVLLNGPAALVDEVMMVRAQEQEV
jgi:hypothetical protein